MGASGQTRGTHVADHLALENLPALANPARISIQMKIGGPITAAMAQFNRFAGLAFAAHPGDDAIGDRKDRRAPGRGVVDAKVGTVALEQRVKAPLREARTDSRIAKRGSQKGAPQRLSLEIIIPAAFVLEVHRGVLPVPHFELSRQNPPVTNKFIS